VGSTESVVFGIPATGAIAGFIGPLEAVKAVLDLRLGINAGKLCDPCSKIPTGWFVTQDNSDFGLRRAGQTAEMHRARMIHICIQH
jgi:hypothetical protein